MAGGIYEQSEWPDSRWDCVTVCDGCHTVVWGTFWGDYDSVARDAYFARNGWRNYCVPGDPEILELCPACTGSRKAGSVTGWPNIRTGPNACAVMAATAGDGPNAANARAVNTRTTNRSSSKPNRAQGPGPG